MAWSQEMSSHWSEPGRRTCGFSSRRSFMMSCSQRRAFGAKRAAIDRVVGIAFHVHYLRGHVLRLVPEGVDDHPATDRAVRAGAARLRGAGDLQPLGLREQGRGIKAEDGEAYASQQSGFENVLRETSMVQPPWCSEISASERMDTQQNIGMRTAIPLGVGERQKSRNLRGPSYLRLLRSLGLGVGLKNWRSLHPHGGEVNVDAGFRAGLRRTGRPDACGKQPTAPSG